MNLGFTEILLMLPVFGLIIIPMILFLIAQQNLLKTIKPDNRRIQPNDVWLQLIPGFNLVWQFFVVDRIAESIRNENIERGSNSLSGAQINEKPTYDLGLAYCILNTVGFVGFFFIAIFIFASLPAIICWIIYWVQIADYRSKFQAFRSVQGFSQPSGP